MADRSAADQRQTEFIVAEYAAAQAMAQHYDSFRWQSGAMLMAGAFVFLGLLSAGDGDTGTYALGSSMVAVVLSVWILFAHHYRQLYMYKFDRIVELEIIMGAEQNRRFNPFSGPMKTYPRFGPRGHRLDLVVFAAIGLGGPGLATVRGNWSAWLLPSIAIVLVTGAVVIWNERRLLAWLGNHRTLPSSTTP